MILFSGSRIYADPPSELHAFVAFKVMPQRLFIQNTNSVPPYNVCVYYTHTNTCVAWHVEIGGGGREKKIEARLVVVAETGDGNSPPLRMLLAPAALALAGLLAPVVSAYPRPVLNESLSTNFAQVRMRVARARGAGGAKRYTHSKWMPPREQVFNPHYGLHVFATGKNGSLYHKYQTGLDKATGTANMTDWICLTPNKTQVWWGDPVAALNKDGRIELFVRFLLYLDAYQLYQTDPKDPLSWSKPRGPVCMCAAADPTDCPWCMNCVSRPECDSQYYAEQATFPTSNMNLLRNGEGGLSLVYRGFDGRMYSFKQRKPGNSSKYDLTVTYDSVFE